MIALPGCTLAIGHEEDFHLIMDTFLEALRRNIETRKPDRMINEIDLPDIPLWTIWAIQQYRRFMGAGKCRERYGAVVRELVEHIRAGRIRNLMADTNGLLKSEGENSPVTWLSASINGRPIIPRTGYILEFNALWYNGLCFLANLYESMGEETAYVAEINALAEKVKESFISTFLNEYGYLYDYVNGAYTDLEVRPNMAIAIGLEYSPLTGASANESSTSAPASCSLPKVSARSAPKSHNYNPVYVGNPVRREYVVHQGPARPWLFGFYADAYFKVFGLGGLPFIERMLISYEDDMSEGLHRFALRTLRRQPSIHRTRCGKHSQECG